MIHIYIYICMYIYIYIHMCVYIYIYIYIHTITIPSLALAPRVRGRPCFGARYASSASIHSVSIILYYVYYYCYSYTYIQTCVSIIISIIIIIISYTSRRAHVVLERGHANLLCIVPMLIDDPRRESRIQT